MSCEAQKYWQYSRECAKQALEAETPEVRDQLLELARVWTEAALCEEMNARPNFSLGKAHNRLIRIAFFFARAVDYWTRGSGTPSRAKACSCRTVGRASIWIVRRSPRGSATSLIVSVPS